MRLLIVSNRLPISIKETDGKIIFQQSAGGLVSGISSYLDSMKGSSSIESDYIWIGWPGISVDDHKKESLKEKMLAECNAYPVFLTEEAMENFYHGFCNKIIWPLFHYFPSYAIYNEEYWLQYVKVNETFRDLILDIIKPGDIVWVQDYHLMLLPQLLKEKIPDISIGFFLHIPFPSYEIFRLLPVKWSKQILEGLLGADLIGFHTHDYTQYFLRSVFRILGFEHNKGIIEIGNRLVKAETFPMGIDYDKFNNASHKLEVIKERNKIKEFFSGCKIILSVDRLDYTKGIVNRLHGYDTFLKNNPQWQGKVILFLIVVPSRIGVEHYQQMKKHIDELVGEINGKYGTITWTPIIYQYKFLPFDPLVSIYSMSDAALITPLRDGMNLIAKEYIAARFDQTGVLVLSKMAGAANEMKEAILINPNYIEEIADSIKAALDMPIEEQKERNKALQIRLKQHDVVYWSQNFMQTLLKIKESQNRIDKRAFNKYQTRITIDYAKANSRLILLDYDGTLVPFTGNPQMANPNQHLLGILNNLTNDPKNEVAIISGRDKESLERWFGQLNIGLAGEHGIWIKEKNKSWNVIKTLKSDWKRDIRDLLHDYADRLPGTFVEEKSFAFAWHYRNADQETGVMIAKDLTEDLIRFTANTNLQVLQGDKVIEIKDSNLNKGTAGLYWLGEKNYDFILVIGDDLTDEDLFKIVPEEAISIKVGIGESYAKYYLTTQNEVIDFLESLESIVPEEHICLTNQKRLGKTKSIKK